MIRLTDEEIGNTIDLETEGTFPCSDGSANYTFDCRPIATAQLKKVYDWGYEDCPHNDTTKKKCDECWQALLKEIEEG